MMVRLDADDAAPGSFSDERTELVEFERVAENVAVGTGELIGERDDRAADRLGRIRNRRAVTRRVVADALACELLEQQRRNVTAAIVGTSTISPFRSNSLR